MHIVLAVIGLLAGAAFWWYRIKMINDAASEIGNVVGKVRGDFRRRKLRKKAAMSPVTAIDDPVVAAAAILAAVAAEDGPLTPDDEKHVEDLVAQIAGKDETGEAMIYAKWAVTQVAETTTVIDNAGRFLQGRLTDDEKEHLLDMAKQVGSQSGIERTMLANTLRRLRQRLGLVVN